LEKYNGDKVRTHKKYGYDGIVQDKHAQRVLQAGHEREPVAMKDIHYHVPGNEHGPETYSYDCKTKVANVAKIFGVKKNSRETHRTAKPADNNNKKKDPEKQQELVSFK
jgi:hypothetical protein